MRPTPAQNATKRLVSCGKRVLRVNRRRAYTGSPTVSRVSLHTSERLCLAVITKRLENKSEWVSIMAADPRIRQSARQSGRNMPNSSCLRPRTKLDEGFVARRTQPIKLTITHGSRHPPGSNTQCASFRPITQFRPPRIRPVADDSIHGPNYTKDLRAERHSRRFSLYPTHITEQLT